MITGLLSFKDKSCVFKLQAEEFILEIEEIEERENIHFSSLSFLFDNKSKNIIQDDLLIGIDFESNKVIHFNVRTLKQTGGKTYTANLNSYLIFDGAEISFDGLQIQADELNWFHDTRQAYFYSYKPENGEAQLQLANFDETTKDFNFDFNGVAIEGNLSISRTISNASVTPIKLASTLNFFFSETKDLTYPEELIFLAQRLLKFITYRENFNITQITLRKKDEKDGQYFKVGELFIFQYKPVEVENEKNIDKRIIEYPLFEVSFSKLLEKLSRKEIYLKHIPENLKDARNVTSARFIMVTAGFEWEFRFLHEEINRNSEDKYKEQKQEILSFLDDKIKCNTGKNKKFFKSYRSLILKSDSSLSEKILWTLSEFDDVLSVFIPRIYNLNDIGNEEFKYEKIAERIQTQRNNIAHGNIDQEIDNLYILDFLVLEWLYYAMVLHDIGMSRENIKRSINKLFNRGLAL